MPSVKDNHDLAMEFADLGLKNRASGEMERALAYFEQALEFEIAAIDALDEKDGLAWSILHRSAGTLALDCQDFRQAEQITTRALAGDPHPAIIDELRDLLEQIYFRRHLELKGIALQDNEMQLSLSGPDVGAGFVNAEEAYGRVASCSRLIYRIAENKQNLPFRRGGNPAKEILECYQTLISVPRSGSFAATLKIGSTIMEPSREMPHPALIVDEFMNIIELVNKSRMSEMYDTVSDPEYLHSFYDLAKKIAPDGDRIHQVGFTATRNGFERSAEITRPAGEIIPPRPPKRDEPEPVTIRGILSYADATTGNKNAIKVTSDGRSYTIRVPEGMMDRIVPSLWSARVTVQGIRSGNVIEMQDIRQG